MCGKWYLCCLLSLWVSIEVLGYITISLPTVRFIHSLWNVCQRWAVQINHYIYIQHARLSKYKQLWIIKQGENTDFTLKSFPLKCDEVPRHAGCFLHLKCFQSCGHRVTSQAGTTHTDPKCPCLSAFMAAGTVVLRETWAPISTAGIVRGLRRPQKGKKTPDRQEDFTGRHFPARVLLMQGLLWCFFL